MTALHIPKYHVFRRLRFARRSMRFVCTRGRYWLEISHLPAHYSLQLLDTLSRNYGGVELRNTRRVMCVGRLVNETFNCDFSHFVLGNVHGGKRRLDQLANTVVVKTHNRDVTRDAKAQFM